MKPAPFPAMTKAEIDRFIQVTLDPWANAITAQAPFTRPLPEGWTVEDAQALLRSALPTEASADFMRGMLYGCGLATMIAILGGAVSPHTPHEQKLAISSALGILLVPLIRDHANTLNREQDDWIPQTLTSP